MTKEQAIEMATVIAYEEDRKQAIIQDNYHGWRVVDAEDAEADLNDAFYVDAEGIIGE